ncbi:MAG: LysE family translocator [Hyphomicrobiales bacterium]|nr:LysE family translocator [Hyphomicrobiales bacterium]MCY4032818.1 LysE family translocator [Hyphomicrobiales bacterium]MCY4039115.1 LysE family translocator [Hyphomicrobiales bacterium]
MHLFPEFSVLIAYLGACTLLQISPGPDQMLVISNSIGRGMIAGILTVFGIFLGILFQAPLLSLGTASLVATYENAFDILCAAGATYLAYLAYKNFRVFFGNQDSTNLNQSAKARSSVVFQGFLTNVTNPKVILFLFAFIPQFTVPDKGHIGLQVLILLAILKINGLFINGSVAVLAGYANHRFLSRKSYTNWSSLFSAIVFLTIAVIFWIQIITR